MLAARVAQALCQSARLYGEDLLAACVELGALRHEGVGVDFARQADVARGRVELCAHHAVARLLRGAGGEGGVLAALRAQAFDVYLADDELFFQTVALAFCHEGAVLRHQHFAAEDHVLRALAEAGAHIDVARYGACALLPDELLDVGVFAHAFVVGREVEDDVGALQRQS